MEECLHELFNANTCVSCGYTISEALVSYTTHMEAKKTGKLNYKYSLPDNDYFINQCILEILPNSPHTNEIKHIVTTKKYKKRTSTIDKILTASYYILKKNDSDVLKVDFVKYCKKGYYHFIKLLSDEFGYIRNTDAYIANILTRIHQYLASRNYKFDKQSIFQKVCKYEDVGCASIVDVALFYIFGNDLIDSFEIYDLGNLTYKSSLKRILNHNKVMNSKKINNAGLIKRIDKVMENIRNRDHEISLDHIDLYIEKKILNGYDVKQLKQMTLKQIKKEMIKEDEYLSYLL